MTFKDNQNREYSLNLTLGNVKRVYDNLGVDLLNPASIDEKTNTPLSIRLIYDDLFLVNVVSELIQKQLKEKGLDKESFLDSLDGASMKTLSDTFFEAYERFFTERGRAVWARAIEKDRKTAAENQEKAAITLAGNESSTLQEEPGAQTGVDIPSGN